MSQPPRVEIVPNICTGKVLLISGGQVIGEMTAAEGIQFAELIKETSNQAKRLHEQFTKRAG